MNKFQNLKFIFFIYFFIYFYLLSEEVKEVKEVKEVEEVEEVKEVKEKVIKVETELVEIHNEKKEDDINIPETLEKYKDVIESLKNEYLQLSKELLDGFDGSEITLLINAFTKTISELRNIIDDLKEVDADDRITIYNLLISAVIIKSIESSELDENSKKQVIDTFQTGGMVLNLIELIRESFKKTLQKMDTNKDNYVDKQEFQKYHEEKYNNECGCFGEEHNKKAAEKFATCCFPLLACGKKKIKINKKK